MTVHVVAYSTGVGSAETAYRLVDEHGADHVVLLTADTRREDEDNWRFAIEVARDLGCAWQLVADGRTPLGMGRDRRVVPNNRLPLCSQVLKIEQMRSWLDAHYTPEAAVLALGLDWTEEHRIEGRVVRGEYRPGTRERWLPWTTEYPLCEPPFYASAPHANCGGACVRAGQKEWERLLRWNRARYLDWEAEEEASRTLLGDVAILKDRRGGATQPLSLRTFRERLERDPSLFDADDVGPCACV